MIGMHSAADIEIRPASQDDATAILKCLAVAFTPYRSQYTPKAFADTVLSDETLHVRMQQMHILVASLDGSVVGTVAGICHEGVGHLRGMAVLPEFHGRGIAAKLLTAIEGYLRSQGCNRITLDTTIPLTAAISFYEKNGYRRSGKIVDFFGMPLLEYEKPV
jgi:ribosomal protein S18 acetylase RimI-like enzyme